MLAGGPMATLPLPTVVSPADHVAGPPQGKWTSTDFTALPDDGMRYELLAGVLYMAPPPTDVHQFANNRMQTYLTIHVEFVGHGRVIGPPFNVVLSPGDTVQPDVTVVLTEHLGRITRKGVIGAPDLVVEIASPSTATFDRGDKLRAYAGAGVPEYWLVDPYAHTVEVLFLTEGSYRSQGIYEGQDRLPTAIVAEFPVAVEEFFR